MLKKCNTEELNEKSIEILDKIYKVIYKIFILFYIFLLIGIIFAIGYISIKSMISNTPYVSVYILQISLLTFIMLFFWNLTPDQSKYYIRKNGICQSVANQFILLLIVFLFSYLNIRLDRGFLNVDDMIASWFVTIMISTLIMYHKIGYDIKNLE